jgi:hypothetical protein
VALTFCRLLVLRKADFEQFMAENRRTHAPRSAVSPRCVWRWAGGASPTLREGRATSAQVRAALPRSSGPSSRAATRPA